MSGLSELWFLLPTGLVVIVLLLWRPRVALYMVLILSPYYFIINSLLTSGRLGIETHFSPVDLLTVLALTGVLVRKLLRNKVGVRVLPLDVMSAGWLFVSAISLIHGIAMGYEAALRSSRGPLLFLLYFVSATELNSDDRRKELTKVILVGAIASGLVGLAGAMQYLTPLLPNLSVGTVGDVFVRPNFFVDPALTIPNTLFMILYSTFIERQSRGTRLGLGVGLGLNVAVLMLSVTRGFWLGMIVAFLVTVFVARKHIAFLRVLRIVVAFAFAVIIIQVVVQSLSRVSLLDELFARFQFALSGGDYRGVTYRIAEVVAYFNSFSESPILGKGFGSPVLFDPSATLGFAHNQYVWVLETTGLIGFFLLGRFLCLGLGNGLRRSTCYNGTSLERFFGVLLVGTLIGFAVVSITSPQFTSPTTVPLLVTLVGVCRAVSVQSPSTLGVLPNVRSTRDV